MKPKVTFLARVNDGTGKFPFVVVQFKKNQPIAPDNATMYYLRYSNLGQRKTESVGRDLEQAFTQYRNREVNHARLRQGLRPLVPDEAPSERLSIADMVEEYLQELDSAVKNGEKSDGTRGAYRNAVIDFQEQCGVSYKDEIDRKVLLGHKNWLYSNLKKRSVGRMEVTVASRFRFLSVFLNRFGIKMVRNKHAMPNDPGLLSSDEAPRSPKKGRNGNAAPDKYSLEEINQLLSKATEDEKDVIQFFLRLGVRDGEAEMAEWSDIDLKNREYHVQPKPKYNWRPKDKERRVIPINGVLLKHLIARQKRQKGQSTFIFPNRDGEPDRHLIIRLHNAAKRAGLKKRPTLHCFRRTFASLMIADSDLQTVQELLGHSDIATTSLYLAPDREKARRASKTAFEGIGD